MCCILTWHFHLACRNTSSLRQACRNGSLALPVCTITTELRLSQSMTTFLPARDLPHTFRATVRVNISRPFMCIPRTWILQGMWRENISPDTNLRRLWGRRHMQWCCLVQTRICQELWIPHRKRGDILTTSLHLPSPHLGLWPPPTPGNPGGNWGVWPWKLWLDTNGHELQDPNEALCLLFWCWRFNQPALQ